MKIVCITDNIEDLRDWDRDFFGVKLVYLTKGKTYYGMNIDSNTFDPKRLAGPFDIDIQIIDDKGKENWFPYYLFKTLDQIRDETIDKILTIN
jgi:hypothetical protein